MAIRVIDDTKLNNIAVAIQAKDSGGQMTVDEMPTRIAEIPTSGGSVEEKDVNFYDWEGTLLFGYSVEEVQAMTSLPAPDTSPNYQTVDHDLLTFQEWTRNLTNIKTWVQNHSDQSLGVGAIYTTTDGQNHDYLNNPRLTDAKSIYMQKRGVTSIDSYAFNNCYSLTAINIPNGVTSIGSYAFRYCYSLTAINIPNGVTSIDNNAFLYCTSLTTINIPNGVTSIGNSAFQYCYSLTAINIPNGVTSIDNNAFLYCTSLTAINIPNGVTSIGSYAFNNCTSLTAINIPNGVTSIGSYAFQHCYSLTAINIPNGVTSIDNNAFQYCTSLTAINIPNGVTSIGDNAFQYCYSLPHINIPDGVTRIGTNAFQNCFVLCDILLESKPTLANTNAFFGLPTNYRIYVPRANLSWFETATNWATIYTQNYIVAIEDHIDYLESIGFNVDKYKEVIA